MTPPRMAMSHGLVLGRSAANDHDALTMLRVSPRSISRNSRTYAALMCCRAALGQVLLTTPSFKETSHAIATNHKHVVRRELESRL